MERRRVAEACVTSTGGYKERAFERSQLGFWS